MNKGKIFAFVAMAVLGGVLYFGLERSEAQSVSYADQTHISCRATLDYPSSNGYTESYTRPNNCHSARVFYNYGTNFQTGNCGAAPWCNWRVRCPVGSTVKTHGSGGGWHYSMSPNIDGMYDGPAHHWCVDANGNQVEPIAGESEANPDHTHSVNVTKVAVAKVHVVDTNQAYYWTFRPDKLGFSSNWVECAGGASGPYSGNADIEYGNFTNHFHCKNPQYLPGDNPEALPTAAATQPSTSLTGYGFSSTDNGKAKDTFLDKGPWDQAPFGTVACVSTTSNKIYYSSTGICPPASQFPQKPSFNLTLTTAGGSAPASAGSKTTTKFKLQNTGPASDYTLNCYTGPILPTELKTVNPDATIATSPSGASYSQKIVSLAASVEQEYAFVVDLSSASVGSFSLTCSANPQGDGTNVKSFNDMITVTAPVAPPSAGSPSTMTINPLTQYGADKYSITLADPEGLKSFTVKRANGQTFYGGTPGGSGSFNVCGTQQSVKTLTSSTVTLPASDFPLSSSITDCNGTVTTASPTNPNVPAAANFDISVVSTPGTLDVRPGYAAATIFKVRNNGSADNFNVACSGTVSGGSSTSPSVTVQGYVNVLATPEASVSVNGVPIVASAEQQFKYYADLANAFPGTLVVTCTVNKVGDTATKTITDRITTRTPSSNGNFALFNVNESSTGKYTLSITDQDGIKDYSVKNKSAAIVWSGTPGAGGTGTACGASGAIKSTTSTIIPIGDADFPLSFQATDCSGAIDSVSGVIKPGALIAVPPPPGTGRACGSGEKCPSGSWCQNGGLQCYHSDAQLTCVPWNDTPTTSTMCPTGTTVCSPADSNCRTAGQYGPSSADCRMSMRCYQNNADKDANNDVYCAKNAMSMSATEVSCPAGYSVCSPGDKNCKQKGDSWTDSNSSYYCMASQQCSLTSGGGVCVGNTESCPSGTKYCTGSSSSCVEPDTKKTLDSTVAGGSYWCGGGGSDEFYSATHVYCPPKVSGSMGGFRSGPEIKTILDKLGSGWGLCSKNNPDCGEPGETTSSNGWCAWWPPNYNPGPHMPGQARLCPSLDSTGTPPGGGDPIFDEKHRDCDMTVYEDRGAASMIKPGYEFRFVDGHYHLCMSDTGRRPAPEPMPLKPHECGPDEVPGMNNSCSFPMYKWNIAEKKFEKCDLNVDVPVMYKPTGTAPQKYTNCQGLHPLMLESKIEQYLAHPPEIDGEWYTPPWDAAAKTFRLSTKTNELEQCSGREMYPMATIMPLPGQPMPYMSPCMPVPEKDRGWMLKKFQAEYKMHQLYSRRAPVPQPVDPGKPQPPILPPRPLPVIPDVPQAQCKQYLAGFRQAGANDKIFWKDVSRQLAQAPEKYPARETVEKLLEAARDLILEIDKTVKGGACAKEAVTDLNAKSQTLHADLFPELSSYLPEISEYSQYARCELNLEDRREEIEDILEKKLNPEVKKALLDLKVSLEAKLAEMSEKAADFSYDLPYECATFEKEVESQIAPLLLKTDQALNDIVDEVISKKLAPVIEQLTKQLEDRGKKIDELLVQMAQLHSALDKVSTAANDISEKITTSYSALSKIEEKFATQKAEIQLAKDSLIPLIGEATQLMKATSCVRINDRERMIHEFGTVASVNWIGDRGDELEKRLRLFIASCKDKDVARDEVNLFIKTVAATQEQNLSESHEKGLTPFADVPTHEWYYGSMATAFKTGFMSQGRPAENVLRQDAILMILRAVGAPDSEVSGRCALKAAAVSSVSEYATCAVNAAYSRGLRLSGSMSAPVSRGEVAHYISVLAKLPAGSATVLENYTDASAVSAEFKTGIAAVIDAKIMVGNVLEDGKMKFAPGDPLTRAALAVVLEQLLPQEKLPAAAN